MTETSVHPSAIVAESARIADSVRIGAYCVIGPEVELAPGVVLHSHAVIEGNTRLGEGVEVFPFAAIGLRPQDLKHDGSSTRLEVGPRTVIREYVTLQPGTVEPAGTALTTIGADCMLMAYCHVAHDCRIGDRIIMANGCQLGGHVVVEDDAVLGGVTTIHQFTRIGRRAITGAASRVQQDVPPFMLADGHPAKLVGLNRVGLERGGYEAATIAALKQAYKSLFVRGPFSAALEDLEAGLAQEHPEVDQLCSFIRASHRGVTRARKQREG